MFNFIARSLRIKLLLIFVIMLLAFSSVHLVIREYWTIPQLVALEVEKDKKDIYKLNSALLRVYDELEMLVYDNAVWDELYNVILTRDLDYLETNFFIPKSFVSLKINGMSFFDQNQTLIDELAIDQNNNPLSSSPFKSIPPSLKKNLLISKQEMINNGQQTLFKQGLIPLNDRLILFVSGSVLPSSGVGDLAGTMLVWSYFDGKIAHQLSEITQTTVTAAQADTFSATTPVIDFNQLDAQTHIRTKLSNIHVKFNDIFNKPALILSYPTPKRMFDDSPFEMSMVMALLMSLVVLLIIYFILTIMIIEPLNKLKATVREVMERGNFQLKTNLERTDEIGRLALLIDVLFNKVHVQQHALKHNNRQLKRLSDTDPLTGIANRRAMMQVLEKLTPSAMPISVIMLDVDYFKKFNDSYGHQQGDLALKHVAKTLKHHTRRQSDVIARYGGEEFVVVLLNTCQSDARNMAYAIREAIEGLAIEHKTSLISQFLTASIGVSCCDEFDSFSIETLLHQADSALYKAKEQGRNCVVDYNSEMHKHAV
ncbi:Phytochrome-like protein cph2 [Pseudoalteromonas sp. P1-9]|uniref:sensor domain-containing diguanylate cyclase n=1 Tax=Pseudoalteromonas sp. P1-9 TaxID=1710354 RepID=UPI0006D5EB0F|nr:diguanylate cyclase [Pseudoalteromonas sp. P1-9]KPV98462.1 Phytochrome-like protein cph2 [Pseudoalteromonas sp. P1-9]